MLFVVLAFAATEDLWLPSMLIVSAVVGAVLGEDWLGKALLAVEGFVPGTMLFSVIYSALHAKC
ncbi:hypothetical protein NF865_07630 [Thermococcus aggregans]|uniref:Uncharacterized protein n=1 Tax=Thermococcus aggregans TaxID=110163 RepID=A0A9E7SN96_THEAG|nr:hypothetical protein [Thermococcus aggregans]USS40196.1 hypothetical protein NF865_07630 [Thermococcus aggregans]